MFFFIPTDRAANPAKVKRPATGRAAPCYQSTATTDGPITNYIPAP